MKISGRSKAKNFMGRSNVQDRSKGQRSRKGKYRPPTPHPDPAKILMEKFSKPKTS
jgi:hypothetical protein